MTYGASYSIPEQEVIVSPIVKLSTIIEIRTEQNVYRLETKQIRLALAKIKRAKQTKVQKSCIHLVILTWDSPLESAMFFVSMMLNTESALLLLLTALDASVSCNLSLCMLSLI